MKLRDLFADGEEPWPPPNEAPQFGYEVLVEDRGQLKRVEWSNWDHDAKTVVLKVETVPTAVPARDFKPSEALLERHRNANRRPFP